VLDASTHHNLAKEDEKISVHNEKAQKSYDAWQKASKAQQIAAGILRGVNPDTQRGLHQTRLQEFTKAHQACERAEGKYQKEVEAEASLKDTGSGKIKLWAPPE
jgi:flagellar biosynthesis/type III secretory pathway protein FliH